MRPTEHFLLDHFEIATLACLERTAFAIGAINILISRDFIANCWRRRAQWAGYARALQLQDVEIDEIDVISWGCGLSIPGRPRVETLVDPFEAFADWATALDNREGRHWREDLPFTPIMPLGFKEAPALLRAIAILGQYARCDPGIDAWLSLPLLLQRMGLSDTPLPCLVAGDKAFRLAPRSGNPIITRTLRDLELRARDGVAMASALEAERRRWIHVLANERKPGALRTLAALTLSEPVFRPEPLAQRLGLTLSGAGKLLERASEHGFLQEVTGRRSWRVYVVPDMARRLGLAPALRGRPPNTPPPPANDMLGSALDAFDAEMAQMTARYSWLNDEGQTD